VKPLAGCVVTNPAGDLLLIHRTTPELTQWELPGGKIEPGESAAAAAVREAREELGVETAIVRELGAATFDHAARSWHYTWFLARITAGEPRPVEAKFDAVGYIPWADLAARTDISINIRNLIAQFPDPPHKVT